MDRIAAGRVLGVSPAAPDHGVERAFRAALRQTHPDQFAAGSLAQRRAEARTRALLDARAALLAPIDLRDSVTLSATATAGSTRPGSGAAVATPPAVRTDLRSAPPVTVAPARSRSAAVAPSVPGPRRSVLHVATALFVVATLLLLAGIDHPGDGTVGLGMVALVLAGIACFGHAFTSAGRPTRQHSRPVAQHPAA